jgi:hypothetical protein
MARRHLGPLGAAMALGALALAAGGLWYAVIRPDGDSTADSVGGGQRAQRRNFEILRGAGEKAPAGVLASIRQGLGRSHGAFHPDSAHFVHAADESLWIVSGDVMGQSTMCLVQAGPGAMSCAPSPESVQVGIALGTVNNPDHPNASDFGFLTIGIAPDWVRAVKVRVAGRPNQMIPVVHNTYSMRANAPILVEEFCRGSGGGCERLMPVDPSHG